MKNQWQPIETAPRETRVLVYDENRGIVTAADEGFMSFHETEWYIRWKQFDGSDLGDGDWIRMIDPTHWMPLPEPPPERE